MLPRVLPRSRITQSIEALTRTFESKTVDIRRIVGYQQTAGRTQGPAITDPVYRGEALFIPAGAIVNVMGLGPFPTQDPHLIIAGNWRIRQGDTLEIDNREYTVESVSDRWTAFLIVKLSQASKRG